jgi:hypothetical protein
MKKSGNRVGLGLVIVGAVAIAVASFLPICEPPGPLSVVSDNTFIENGSWLLILLAVLIGFTGGGVSQQDGKGWLAPTIMCVVAGALLLGFANSDYLRTLYPVVGGGPDTSQPGVVAALGIALYVAGAGVAVALVGSLMLRQSGHAVDAETVDKGDASVGGRTKKCPDCAETVLADAKVCKHCGYRFAPPTDG